MTTPLVVKIKWLEEPSMYFNGSSPVRGSLEAAGYDLVLPYDVEIPAQGVKKIGLGFALEIPKGYYGEIVERSSTHRLGISLANKVGIIDSDYRGEICVQVAVNNISRCKQEHNLFLTLNAGTRIAQMIFKKHEEAIFIDADELQESFRGSGGFGSTG